MSHSRHAIRAAIPGTLRYAGRAAVIAILLAVVFPGTAHAYLDPATGSIVLQAVVGGVMGGLFLVKRYWRQLKARFTRQPESGSEAPIAPPGRDTL
jgi:hypothetical protein